MEMSQWNPFVQLMYTKFLKKKNNTRLPWLLQIHGKQSWSWSSLRFHSILHISYTKYHIPHWEEWSFFLHSISPRLQMLRNNTRKYISLVLCLRIFGEWFGVLENKMDVYTSFLLRWMLLHFFKYTTSYVSKSPPINCLT
jgi:hypothetical protein